MFSVVLIALCGVAVGFALRGVRGVQRVNSTITLTICFMLFVLGVAVGEDERIVRNLWRFGGQALLISLLGVAGSVLAALAMHRYATRRKGGAR